MEFLQRHIHRNGLECRGCGCVGKARLGFEFVHAHADGQHAGVQWAGGVDHPRKFRVHGLMDVLAPVRETGVLHHLRLNRGVDLARTDSHILLAVPVGLPDPMSFPVGIPVAA